MPRSAAVRIVIAIAVVIALVLVVQYGGSSLMETMRRLHHRP